MIWSVARPEAIRSKDTKTYPESYMRLKFLLNFDAVNMLRLMGSFLVICNLNAESYHGPLADHWSSP